MLIFRIPTYTRKPGSSRWCFDVSRLLVQRSQLIIRADHVDILGATPLNEAILKIAAGRGDLVTDKIESGILEYVEKMQWE